MHPRQKLDQSALVILFFLTEYGRRVHLYANETTTENAVSVPVGQWSPFVRQMVLGCGTIGLSYGSLIFTWMQRARLC